MKFYDAAACNRKADQHWEMAGLARKDGDAPDAEKHSKLAQQWSKRAGNGGHHEKESSK